MKQFTRPPFNLCAQCGATLVAPTWAEHLDERRVRNVWPCSAWGHEFESTVCFPSGEASEQVGPQASSLVH
jgi:hypothetical protein